MKRKIAVIATVAILVWGCVVAARVETLDTVFARQLARGTADRAMVCGYFFTGYEVSSIFHSNPFSNKGAADTRCWVEWQSYPSWSNASFLSGYAIIEGSFEASNRGHFGHMGQYKGIVRDARFVVYPVPILLGYLGLAVVGVFFFRRFGTSKGRNSPAQSGGP